MSGRVVWVYVSGGSNYAEPQSYGEFISPQESFAESHTERLVRHKALELLSD